MGVWDEYCVICGGPLRNFFTKGREMYSEDTNNFFIIPKTITKYNWLNKLYIITSVEENIKALGEQYTEYGEFKVKNNLYIITPMNWHNDSFKNIKGYGTVCHRDCYELLIKELDYFLSFSNICRLLKGENNLLRKRYGAMDKYIGQDYDYYSANKENSWLLESPLKNIRNKDRILNIWKPLVDRFNKKPLPISPCEPASKFKLGFIIKGYGDTNWIVKKINGVKKWVQIK